MGHGPEPTAEGPDADRDRGEPAMTAAETAARDQELAARDRQLAQARREHLRSFLGEPVELVEDVHPGGRVAVLLFPPTERLPFVTLVTDGLSGVPLAWHGWEQEGARPELVLGLPAGWPGLDPLDPDVATELESSWPVTVLRVVGELALREDEALAWATTVGGPDFRELLPPGVPFSGVLVGPPLAYPPGLSRATTPMGEVPYRGLLPVTAGELDFKLGVPYGGPALLERLWSAGVTAVVDPQRPGVVDGPPPWSVHVLLREHPDHLGRVLDHYLPSLAVALAEDRARSYLLPLEKGGVRWRLEGPMDVPTVERDTACSADEEFPVLQEAVPAHRAAVELTPEGGHGLDALAGVLAMVVALCERDDVLAVWFPQQQHVTTPARLLADVDRIDLSYRVEPTPDPSTVRTRGLAALGGLEVRLTAPQLKGVDVLEQRLRAVLSSRPEDGEELPAPGQRGRYGLTRYLLVEAVDPGTGEPCLELVDGGWRGRFGR